MAAPILSLANVNGQEQINIQVPFGLAGPTVTAVVENQGSLATISGIPLSAAQPGVFEYALNNQLYAAVLHADYSVVTPSNPARPGEVLLLFATALGAVTPPVPTNQAGPSSPLSTPIAMPAVTLGGVEQVIEGAFYAPQLISVYQINFRVGANVQPGTLDLVISSRASPAKPRSCRWGGVLRWVVGTGRSPDLSLLGNEPQPRQSAQLPRQDRNPNG
ncbi:MAG: hypothetical protein R2724_17190 [Bryobacterales bacterium]